MRVTHGCAYIRVAKKLLVGIVTVFIPTVVVDQGSEAIFIVAAGLSVAGHVILVMQLSNGVRWYRDISNSFQKGSFRHRKRKQYIQRASGGDHGVELWEKFFDEKYGSALAERDFTGVVLELVTENIITDTHLLHATQFALRHIDQRNLHDVVVFENLWLLSLRVMVRFVKSKSDTGLQIRIAATRLLGELTTRSIELGTTYGMLRRLLEEVELLDPETLRRIISHVGKHYLEAASKDKAPLETWEGFPPSWKITQGSVLAEGSAVVRIWWQLYLELLVRQLRSKQDHLLQLERTTEHLLPDVDPGMFGTLLTLQLQPHSGSIVQAYMKSGRRLGLIGRMYMYGGQEDFDVSKATQKRDTKIRETTARFALEVEPLRSFWSRKRVKETLLEARNELKKHEEKSHQWYRAKEVEDAMEHLQDVFKATKK